MLNVNEVTDRAINETTRVTTATTIMISMISCSSEKISINRLFCSHIFFHTCRLYFFLGSIKVRASFSGPTSGFCLRIVNNTINVLTNLTLDFNQVYYEKFVMPLNDCVSEKHVRNRRKPKLLEISKDNVNLCTGNIVSVWRQI